MTRLIRWLSAGFTGAVLACGESPVALDTGTLEVTSATQGDTLDPDGFALSLDGGPAQSLGPNASLTLAGLLAGSHTLNLSGLAPNCTLSSPNPLTATVPAGGTARVAFEVGCSAPGTLEVSTVTTGQDLDPDGYLVSVDGGAGLAVALDGQVTIAGLLAGTHSVRLSGLAANCSLAGLNPLTVAITAGGTQAVRFEVVCAALGAVKVTTMTSGPDPDPDGYQLQVDGGLRQPLGSNASVTLKLAPGAHTLTLSGVAPNCAVIGANPLSVTLASGETAETTFEVSCTSLPSGQILVTTTTRTIIGGLTDPNGYTVSLDGGQSGHIGTDSSIVFADVAPGAHVVALGDVYRFCGLFLVNPRTVSVRAGATTGVRFDVICVN